MAGVLPPRDPWHATIAEVVPAIVNIVTSTTLRFSTKMPGTGRATGFVVSTEYGLILTNRHVIGEGPTDAYAIFGKGALKCPITPCYIDPVHDFTICKYDVTDLEGFKVKQIELKPEFAKVGLEVRVIGNDTNQVLSILPGVISRLDRNPMHWDALTEYIQAAADTSGGSSGSPLLTENGYAVGMVAGGYQIQSLDFYLPLQRPRKHLQDWIDGRTIVRGTIQSNWLRETRADCLTRGLDSQTFEEYCPDGNALLRASKVLPQGLCAGKVEEDDLLLQANRKNVTSLNEFENLIDKGTGSSITLLVWRHGQDHEVMLDVKDLFTLVPYRILEFAGSHFQDLRHEVAMAHDLPLRGVVLTFGRGSFNFARNDIMITHLDNRSTPNLDTFIEVAQTIQDDARVALKYRSLDAASPRHRTITMDRHYLYSAMRLWVRGDNIATWTSTDIESSSTVAPLVKRFLPNISVAEPRSVNRPVPYTVRVKATTQSQVNGAPAGTKIFLSPVINEMVGWIVVPQAFAPSSLCSLVVIFEECIELPATKVFASTSGYAIAQYDPGLIQGTIERATFSDVEYQAGDKITVYALTNGRGTPCALDTTVRYVEPLSNNYDPEVFHHPIHVEILHLHHNTSLTSGVLLDNTGKVVALWLPFIQSENDSPIYVGVPISLLGPEIEQLQRGTLPEEFRLLDVLLEKVSKNDVTALGVPEDFPSRHFVQVAETPCTHQGLKAGDVLLRHGEKQITKVSHMYGLRHERLELSVIRAGTEIHVEVSTVTMASYLVDRVVWFCGAQLETPYSPVHFYTQKIHSRIWISSVLPASPASMFHLPILHFITRINNELVEDLDSLVRAIKLLPEDQYCQITCVSRVGVSRIVPVRPNMRDFKTSQVRKVVGSQKWQYQELRR